VAAQRLIRVLCTDCKASHEPDQIALQTIGITPEQAQAGRIHKAVGCDNCFTTGYRGRIGIFEFMLLDSELKSLILQAFDSNKIKQAALENGMITLRRDGVEKVLNGTTTIEEVLRVTQK